jgi:teichuronic acid biosynthesis glycosyltransferase TuaG
MKPSESVKNPAVSVIMPAYNCEKYIEAAIRSVMVQTFRDWELIVLDDGSHDSTREIIERLAKEDCRIRPMPNEKNMGVARTRNRGIDNSRGDYVALLDSDDIWHSDKLGMQIEKMRASCADISYCSYAIIDSEGVRVKKDYTVPETTDFKALLKENYIGCSTVVLSRKVLEERRFLTDYYHEDYVLWLDLLREGVKAVGCTETLAEWRLIRNSRSFDKRRSAAHRWDIYRNHLHFSRAHSLWLLAAYAVNGVKKYLK